MHKTRKVLQKFYKLVLTVLILALIVAGSGSVLAAPGTTAPAWDYLPRQKVRVGIFAFNGYHMRDDSGHISGYGYELLQLLARYSNWDYEYVGYDKSWEEMQEMLANGQLDLLTSAHKTPDRESRFAFSDRPVGYSNIIFTTLPGNERFTAGSYQSYNGARVGLLRGNSRNQEFAAYAKEYGFTYTPVYYENADALLKALQNRQVDAIVSSNLRAVRNEWILNQFSPAPFYAMVPKNKPQLLFQLNNAITQLDIYQPEWRSELWNRYYGGSSQTSIPFSVRELAYLKSLTASGKVFTVLMEPDNAPYSYFDQEGKPVGIFPEIFAVIAQKARIQYQILPVKSEYEYQQQLRNGIPDIYLNAFYDYNAAEKRGYELTSPYWNAVLVQMLRKGYTGQVHTVATVLNPRLHTLEDKDILKGKIIRLYPDTATALDAVRDGNADAVYLYRFTAQNVLRQDTGTSWNMLPLPHGNIGISLGVNSRNDYRLFAILNKAVDITNNTNLADEIAYKYTINLLAPQPFSLRRYINEHPAVAVGISSIMVLILAGIYLYWQKSKAEAKERQQMLVLQDALEVANRASQTKGNFLSSMSHEIRTPLNAILGYMALAKSPDTTSSDIQHYLDGAQLAAKQLLQIINDVLDISSIESGRFKIAAAPFQLRATLAQITTIFVAQARQKNVQLETVIESLKADYLVGDQYRVNQVLMNLLSNAIKFTPAGGRVRLMVSQTFPKTGLTMVKFTVTDTGIGISKEFLSRIFKPFEQQDASTARKFGGTGLGLSITRNLVRLMNGSIEVESEENQGTTFTVTLPFKVEEGQSPQQVELPELVLPENMSGLKILLVEDNALNREIAVSILHKLGLVVETAVDGRDAVQKFTGSLPGTYQCLLMDIQMPIMNGYDATRAIRTSSHAEASTIPIIAVTADVFEEDVARVMACGMNGYISKPVDYKKLLQVLTEILEKQHREN
jgi:signal transduction histidine kinase